MLYHSRFAERKLKDFSRWFKAVMLLGARQTGKTTLLRKTFPEVPLLTFDPVQDLYGARQTPDLFLDSFPPPLILDEIQYAPELFAALKRRIDRREMLGQYFLTGSQNPAMLKQVAESLAGRIGILGLDAMGAEELAGAGARAPWLKTWLESKGAAEPARYAVLPPETGGVLRAMWRGGMPGLLELPDAAVPSFLNSYLHTYVERDTRSVGEIRDIASFGRFAALCAALTAQEINTVQFGREIGIAPATARKWFDVLQATYQWREIPAFSGNAVKRLSGKSKGYLTDTGLACLLQRVGSVEALSVSPLRGALFETLMVNGLHKQFVTLDSPPGIYHWRTTGGAEADAVLDWEGARYPIGIKCKTELNGHDLRGIRAFRETYTIPSPAVIVYAGAVCRKLDDLTLAMPWNAISQ
ncbi:MAG: ATP-binding protein [Candidatus Accumulibacter sp.]|jgi:predicted AAA+ superfamily ATPase|nr:ATP-binding protein [Accumulibacter sp.]